MQYIRTTEEYFSKISIDFKGVTFLDIFKFQINSTLSLFNSNF